MKRVVLLSVLFLSLLVTWEASAVIFSHKTGIWPQTWPQELEPLRAKSTTVDVATGTQEHHYRIPFENREEFETSWPHLLKVRSKGSSLTLRLVDEKHSGGKAMVLIVGPAAGGLIGGNFQAGKSIDPLVLNEQLANRTVLKVGPPWPKELFGPQGELPEYVTVVKLEGGKLGWRSLAEVPEGERGFHHRARIEITLFVDGNVIDLNRIPLPEDALLIDRRFPADPAS